MFASLSRRLQRAVHPIAAGGPDAARPEFDDALVEDATRLTPYSYFFPRGQPTAKEKDDSLDPRRQFQKHKADYLLVHSINLDPYKKSNLRIIHQSFIQYMDSDGTLSAPAYEGALQAVGVQDIDLLHRTFALFDTHQCGSVEYREIISALDVILNGTNQAITAMECFSLLDTTKCGYIIKNILLEHRAAQREDPLGVNHLMIKILLELFTQMQAEEEQQWAKATAKKGKRSAKARKAGATRPVYCGKIHMSFEEFRRFLQSNPMLVQAFITQILLTMESVYNRNKAAAARIAMRQGVGAGPALDTSSFTDSQSAAVSGGRGLLSPEGGRPLASSRGKDGSVSARARDGWSTFRRANAGNEESGLITSRSIRSARFRDDTQDPSPTTARRGERLQGDAPFSPLRSSRGTN